MIASTLEQAIWRKLQGYDVVSGDSEQGQSAPASGSLRGSLVVVPAGAAIASIYVGVDVAGTGITHAIAAVYGKTGALVSQSADSPTLLQSTGRKKFDILTPVQHDVTDGYYLVIWATQSGGAMPGLQYVANSPNTTLDPAPGGIPRSIAITGLASLPSTVALTSAKQEFWFGAVFA